MNVKGKEEMRKGEANMTKGMQHLMQLNSCVKIAKEEMRRRQRGSQSFYYFLSHHLKVKSSNPFLHLSMQMFYQL